MSTHREKLIRYYSVHSPDKVNNVDAALSKYVGKEHEMWQQLEAKYGRYEDLPNNNNNNPRASSPFNEPSGMPSFSSHRDRLIAFYSHYSPDKVQNVDATLAKYVGQENSLFAQLTSKYGPEPTPSRTVSTSSFNASSTNSPPPASPTSLPSPNNPYRPRLLQFYRHFAPEKCESVDAVLERYNGREESHLFPMLTEKYGTFDASVQINYAERLKAYYTHYCPERLPTIAKVLERFAGRENELLLTLRMKYGPDPSMNNLSLKDRLVRFYMKYDPEKIERGDEIDHIVRKYKNEDVEKLFGTLCQKYGPEPTTSVSPTQPPTHRSRLVAFYKQYSPDKLNTIDAILEKYAGQENSLFAQLTSKYGPEPAPTGGSTHEHFQLQSANGSNASSAASAGAFASSASAIDPAQRERLFNFYFFYDPAKLADLDKLDNILARYKGREKDLYIQLVAKFGDEPPAFPTGGRQEQAAALMDYYAYWAPEKANPRQVETALAVYEPYYDELWYSLANVYGPLPVKVKGPGVKLSLQERLMRFYRQYDPSRAHPDYIQFLIHKYGDEVKELFKALQSKYGPEPST